MSSILQRELADVLSNRWPTAPDVDRIAEASGLSRAEIARYPRPIDHWSAAVAKAIDQRVVARLMANAELHENVRRRYAVLDEPLPGGDRPISLGFTLEWSDVDDDKRTRAWLVETGGTTRALTAEVRVYGGPSALQDELARNRSLPTLRWRRRRVLGIAPWEKTVPLTRLGHGETVGFSAWRAETHLKVGSLRASRIDVVAEVGDQRKRLDRLLVPALGTYAAALLGIVLLGFVARWLLLLPGPALDIGLSGAVILAMPVIVQGLVTRDGARGPLWGLGMVERATVAVLIAATLLITMSWSLLVIVDNQIKNKVSYFTSNKEERKVSPGRQTIWRRQTPEPEDDKTTWCVCRASSDPACSCEAQTVYGIPVVRLQCRQQEWTGLPSGASPGPDGNVTIGGNHRAWLKLDKECHAPGAATLVYNLESISSAAHGELTVCYPWSTEFGELRITTTAIAPKITITNPSHSLPAPPLMKLDVVAYTGPLLVHALDPKHVRVDIRFDDHKDQANGDLRCDYKAGSEPTDVDEFDAKASVKALTVSGDATATSQWTATQPGNNVRVCLRKGASVDQITFTVPKAVPGAVYNILDSLPHQRITLEVGGQSISIPCPAAQFSVIQIDERFKTPITANTIDGSIRLNIQPGDIADKHLALVCDPPKEISVNLRLQTSPDVSRDLFVLDNTTLRAATSQPPPVTSQPAICRVDGQDYAGAQIVFECSVPPCKRLRVGDDMTTAERGIFNDAMANCNCKKCRTVCKC